MNTINLVLILILSISFLIYLISEIKKIKFLNGITALLFIPLSCFIIINELTNYLPDSKHLIMTSIISVIIISLREFFIWFRISRLEKIMNSINYILYTANIFCWVQFYKSTFYIYTKSTTITILVIIFFVILYFLFFKKLGKQYKKTLLFSLLPYTLIAYLNYCALTSLVNNNNIANKFLLLSSLFYTADFIFYTLQTTNPIEVNRKIEKYLRLSLITIAEFLITASGLLMIN